MLTQTLTTEKNRRSQGPEDENGLSQFAMGRARSRNVDEIFYKERSFIQRRYSGDLSQGQRRDWLADY